MILPLFSAIACSALVSMLTRTVVNRRKDGTLYDQEETITPIRDDPLSIGYGDAVGCRLQGASLQPKLLLHLFAVHCVGDKSDGVTSPFQLDKIHSGLHGEGSTGGCQVNPHICVVPGSEGGPGSVQGGRLVLDSPRRGGPAVCQNHVGRCLARS